MIFRYTSRLESSFSFQIAVAAPNRYPSSLVNLSINQSSNYVINEMYFPLFLAGKKLELQKIAEIFLLLLSLIFTVVTFTSAE